MKSEKQASISPTISSASLALRGNAFASCINRFRSSGNKRKNLLRALASRLSGCPLGKFLSSCSTRAKEFSGTLPCPRRSAFQRRFQCPHSMKYLEQMSSPIWPHFTRRAYFLKLLVDIIEGAAVAAELRGGSKSAHCPNSFGSSAHRARLFSRRSLRNDHVRAGKFATYFSLKVRLMMPLVTRLPRFCGRSTLAS
jgi:hypothetical protein